MTTFTSTRGHARAASCATFREQVTFAARLLDLAACVRGAPDALRIPADVRQLWGELLTERFRALPSAERAAVLDLLAEYRSMACEDERQDAAEALALLDAT